MLKNGLKYFSIFISIIFHPLIISAYTFYILVYQIDDNLSNKNNIFFICLIFSNIIPIITVLYLKYKKIISDLDASIKEHRILPLSLGVVYASLGFIFLYNIQANLYVQGLMFSYITNSIIIILITKYWKISIHAIGVTGPFAVLYLFGYKYITLMILITILVCAARIILNAHDFKQVTIGSIFGFLSTFLQINIYFL
jgi:membrane-associated phospholipid phosphatase